MADWPTVIAFVALLTGLLVGEFGSRAARTTTALVGFAIVVIAVVLR